MKIKVERVNPSGKSFLSGGEIYKLGKGANVRSFNGLEGQDVEIESESGWVTKLTTSTGNMESKSSTTTERPTSSYSGKDPQTRLEIARGTAVKAAAEVVKGNDGDFSERVSDFFDLTEKITSYILTGDRTVLTGGTNVQK